MQTAVPGGLQQPNVLICQLRLSCCFIEHRIKYSVNDLDLNYLENKMLLVTKKPMILQTLELEVELVRLQLLRSI